MDDFDAAIDKIEAIITKANLLYERTAFGEWALDYAIACLYGPEDEADKETVKRQISSLINHAAGMPDADDIRRFKASGST